jgi:Domain of unknown function (DUF1932)
MASPRRDEIMDRVEVGILHPGEMGACVAGLLAGTGKTVLWVSSGRGPQTRQRAEAAGLSDAGSLASLARRSAVVLSVCPPSAALDVARAAAGFRGVYVDANAVSPATAREIASLIEAGGGECVDGGIVGPPPRSATTTRLYLSGARAGEVSELFAGTVLQARAVGDEVGAASAVKMCYAAWTKGTAALLLAIRAAARAEGVEDVLLGEWDLSVPDLAERSLRAAQAAGGKGWRWVAEMEEIAATFAACGLPAGFHQAAAEIFRRSPRLTGATSEETLESVLAGLTERLL